MYYLRSYAHQPAFHFMQVYRNKKQAKSKRRRIFRAYQYIDPKFGHTSTYQMMGKTISK